MITAADRRDHEKRLDHSARRDHAPAAFVLWPAMNILSIQSHVAYGHVGNAAAMFPLQRIGVEVWPVHTVQFSNHTGYGAWTGRVFDAGLIRDVVQGIEERGVLGECDGVLSGYMGSAEIGEAILDAVARVKRANPPARYCCDPVIGDVGRGVFVRPGIPEFMRERAVPAADIVTPNQFELDHLSGRDTRDMARRARRDRGAARARAARGAGDLAAHRRDAGRCDRSRGLATTAGRFRVRTPKLPISVNGAGDAIAALFFAHFLRTGSAAEALSRAASSVFGVLRRTAEAGSREILLVEAQDELVKPSRDVRGRAIVRPSCAAASSRSTCSPTSASPAIRSRSCSSRTGSTPPRCRRSRASSICPETVFVFPPADPEASRARCASSRRRASCRSPAIRRSAPRCCSAHLDGGARRASSCWRRRSGRCRAA